MIPNIQYVTHDGGPRRWCPSSPASNPARASAGMGWALESFRSTRIRSRISTRHGTTIQHGGGLRALTIDEVPLEWCTGDGVRIVFRKFPGGYLVTAADRRPPSANELYAQRGRYRARKHRRRRLLGQGEYLIRGCGMGREATSGCQRGSRGRTDAWSWSGRSAHRAEFQKCGDRPYMGGHFAGFEQGYCHIEKLTNLDRLPPFCFTVTVSH
jgi:hypothetical protein